MKNLFTNLKLMRTIKILFSVFFFLAFIINVNGETVPNFIGNGTTTHSPLVGCGSLTPNITGASITISNNQWPTNPDTTVGSCSNLVYKWQYSDYGTFGTWSDINSYSASNIDFPNNITYSYVSGTSRTFYIRRAAYSSCNLPVFSQTEAWTTPIIYTIYPPFTVSMTSQTNISCYGNSTVAATAVLSG